MSETSTKFTRKHLCQSLFLIKKTLWHRCFFNKKETLAKLFSCINYSIYSQHLFNPVKAYVPFLYLLMRNFVKQPKYIKENYKYITFSIQTDSKIFHLKQISFGNNKLLGLDIARVSFIKQGKVLFCDLKESASFV